MNEKTLKLNKQLCYYVASLCIAAIEQNEPINKPKELTWQEVYQLVQFHHVEGICYYSIANLHERMDHVLFKEWTKAKDQTLLRSLQFSQERQKILKSLHLHDIATLPVKGAVIESYYPYLGMRFMSDNDILYCYKGNSHPSEQDITDLLVRIMKAFQYDVGSIGGHQKAFYKKPCFNFELHESLFNQKSSYYPGFSHIWQLAKETSPLHYELSLEEQYVYCIAHGAKHYYGYGTGIRLLCDVAAYLTQKEKMNWAYIESRLQSINLLDFEKQLRTLHSEIKMSQKLCNDSEYMLMMLMSAGTYGHLSRGINNRIRQLEDEGKRCSKLVYFKERLFMSSQDLAIRYPRLSQVWGVNKMLIILRMLSAICFSFRRIFKEVVLVIQR